MNDTPTAWLWHQLDALLSDATLDDLRRRYDAYSHRYGLAGKIKQTQRELAWYEKAITTYGLDSTVYRRCAKMIATRKARIAKLQDEQNVIE